MKDNLAVLLFSLAVALIAGVIIIPLLRKLKFGQNILHYVKEHDYKNGTPTMGGVIFVIPALLGFILFMRKNAYLSAVCIGVGLGYMLVGFIDDFIKIKLKRNEGLSPVQKIVFECLIALIICFFAVSRGLTRVYIPFSDKTVDLGWWFIPICIFVFLASTNSVNLTDGLDGLAAGVSYIYFGVLSVIIIIQTKTFSSNYVNLNEYKNLSVLSSSFCGGLIGYLLFNTFKASVFMGDTGSLCLGGMVAVISILSGNMLFIPLIGIMYAITSISVIMQVSHFKATGKRIFLMAPLHHHFQHKGYSESKIAFGYKLVTLIMGLICILSYL